MQSSKHMIDNRDETVADHLRRNLTHADFLRVVSAYFSIYGYETLQDELDNLENVRFLYGDPSSVGEVDPGQKEPKTYSLTENGIEPNHALVQKHLAKRCKAWVEQDSVAIKSISLANFLHGKMYLTRDADKMGTAIVGSSNFTKSGLGSGQGSNIEINLKIDDRYVLEELTDWFDELWANSSLTSDAKQQVIDALNRVGKEHAAEFIYFKTLYELFRDQIEARQLEDQQLRDTHLYDTKIWKALFEFQKDGAKSIIDRLNRYNGCILADSVGLGKTYTALAVIKYFELKNHRVLVLSPKKLEENWSLYPAYNSHNANPFIDDRFAYSLKAHTDLSLDPSRDNFNWRTFDLLVIDESHNFRNHEGKRYQRLLDEVIRDGVGTKVLMLSATPVNTSLIDLRNQIHLMTERREDSFNESLGISNIDTLLNNAQQRFKQWEGKSPQNGRGNKSELIDNLGADFFRLLGGVSISRSRKHIENFYSDEMVDIGTFPERAKPQNFYPETDLDGQLNYKTLANQIESFKLSIYRPSDYITNQNVIQRLREEKENLRFNQADREHYLVGMIRTNFLKRLESSAHSLTLTLERTIGKIDDLLDKIERFESSQTDQSVVDDDTLPDDDDDDEEFLVNRGRNPYRLSDLNLSLWKPDLLSDRAALTKAYDNVKRIDPSRDGKLRQIRSHIRQRAQNPTNNKNDAPNRKLLVFTTFKDTAEYLYGNLKPLADELDLNIAMVSGDQTYTNLGTNNFHDILTNFAPVARSAQEPDADQSQIDILIATDCISEGQNLQDCDTVVNYDIHWNPVRVIQRFGRIDRIGSRAKAVHMMNYWPTSNLEDYLRLQSRVQSRMALADATATGHDDLLEQEESIQSELNFRDTQLKQLIENVPDIEDLDDSISMSDFTLDYFFAQLLRYLEQNRDELEATPPGAYAVVPSPPGENHSGVIWLLRQRNASTRRNARVASPVHPHYLVYIRDNGDIRIGCANTKRSLELFEDAASGHTEPLLQLCDQFDNEINNGTDMSAYNDLLNAVARHINNRHASTQLQNLGRTGSRDFKLSKRSETPRDISDFELVTWLVLKSPQP